MSLSRQQRLETVPSSQQRFFLSAAEPVYSQLQCSICGGLVRKATASKVCLHRFCGNCLEQYLRDSATDAADAAAANDDDDHYDGECVAPCPQCGKPLGLPGQLRADPEFDALVHAIVKDASQFERWREAQQEEAQEAQRQRDNRLDEALASDHAGAERAGTDEHIAVRLVYANESERRSGGGGAAMTSVPPPPTTTPIIRVARDAPVPALATRIAEVAGCGGDGGERVVVLGRDGERLPGADVEATVRDVLRADGAIAYFIR